MANVIEVTKHEKLGVIYKLFFPAFIQREVPAYFFIVAVWGETH